MAARKWSPVPRPDMQTSQLDAIALVGPTASGKTAAAALCASTVGQNSGWSRIDDHTVQCHTKRGHKLARVTL